MIDASHCLFTYLPPTYEKKKNCCCGVMCPERVLDPPDYGWIGSVPSQFWIHSVHAIPHTPTHLAAYRQRCNTAARIAHFRCARFTTLLLLFAFFAHCAALHAHLRINWWPLRRRLLLRTFTPPPWFLRIHLFLTPRAHAFLPTRAAPRAAAHSSNVPVVQIRCG